MINSERWDFVSRLLTHSVDTLSPSKLIFRHKIGLWAIRCQCLQTGATDVLNSRTFRYEKIIVSTSFGSIIIEGALINLSFIECVMYFDDCCCWVKVSVLVESLPAMSAVGILLKGVGSVELKRKPRLTFCVNVRPWPHSDTGTWAPFWNQGTLRV